MSRALAAYACKEAALIHEKNITAAPQALKAQVARYGGSSLDVYIDGALLLWDLAHPAARTLSCAWWAEYRRASFEPRSKTRAYGPCFRPSRVDTACACGAPSPSPTATQQKQNRGATSASR